MSSILYHHLAHAARVYASSVAWSHAVATLLEQAAADVRASGPPCADACNHASCPYLRLAIQAADEVLNVRVGGAS